MWPQRSSLKDWAISSAPNGNSVNSAKRPTPVIMMATSTSTSVTPGRRVMASPPSLGRSQAPGGRGVLGLRVPVAAGGIDRVIGDQAGARVDHDQRLLGGGLPGLRGVAQPQDDLAGGRSR